MTTYMTEGYKILNNIGEEEIIQIPYNINNILINEEDVINILNNFNVKVDKIYDIEVIRQAFVHKSYCKKAIYLDDILMEAKKELGNPSELLELQKDSYETKEFLGDSVLKVNISFYLYKRYPDQNEGFMTRLKTKLEDKTNLALMSKKMGLGKFFIISKHIEAMNGRNSERIHEDVFEAFFGALFLSNGFEPCCLLIINLLETLIDYSDKLYCDNNYKDALLRHHHVQEWTHPKYEIIYFEGPAHKRRYIVGVQKYNIENYCENKNKYIGYGVGNSHKEGEQQAAKMALIIYGILKEDQYIQSDIYYPCWDKIEKNLNNVLSLKDNIDKNIIDKINIDETIIYENNIDEISSQYSEKSI